jgi:hypothetical protein
VQAFVPENVHAFLRAGVIVCWGAFVEARFRSDVLAYIHACVQACLQLCELACRRACVHPCFRAGVLRLGVLA